MTADRVDAMWVWFVGACCILSGAGLVAGVLWQLFFKQPELREEFKRGPSILDPVYEALRDDGMEWGDPISLEAWNQCNMKCRCAGVDGE